MTPDPSKSPALFLQLEYDADRASGDVAEAAFAELYGCTYGNATDAECDDYARAEIAELIQSDRREAAAGMLKLSKARIVHLEQVLKPFVDSWLDDCFGDRNRPAPKLVGANWMDAAKALGWKP